MKETQKLPKEAQLSKAETEVREMLAKLEHLRNVLLAEDLDFQMKLARLRQMRSRRSASSSGSSRKKNASSPGLARRSKSKPRSE